MSNPFAILAEYPENGPEVPQQREKVRRDKNKHESGTGRRDKEKREGRGRSNWGNALDEAKRPQLTDDAQNEDDAPQQEEPKIQYVSASQFFSDSDEDDISGVPQPSQKRVVNVPSEYANLIVEKRDKHVEVRKYDSDDEDGLQTGFLNTAQALQQRRTERSDRPPRGGRGGSRGGPRGRGGRGGPRRGGDYQRGRGGRGGPRHEDGEPAQPQPQQGQEQERKPRGESRGPRDRRPGNVQHQRDNNNRGAHNRSLNLEANFPSLH